MSKAIYGGQAIQNAQEVAWYDSDSSNFLALKAPTSLSGDTTLNLPDGDSTGTQALVSNGSGTLSWADFLDDTLNAGEVFIGNSSNVATGYDTDLVGDIVGSIASFDFVDGDVNTGTDEITETSHGLANDQIVYLTNSGGALPTGLSASTAYYVIVVDANTIQLSLTAGGSAVDITAAAGGGTHTLNYGGLELKAGVVANANIVSDADIAHSKMAALTASRAMVTDGSGVSSASSVTATELGHVSGVTSAIQTQLDAKAGTALDNLASVAINTSLVSDTNDTDDLGSAAIGWANVYGNIWHMDSNSQTTAIQGSASASASVTYSMPPAAPAANGYVLASQTDGTMSWVSNASSNSFATNWVTGDGTSKTVNHALSSQDVIVQIYDQATNATIEVDSVVRTDANNVDLTSSVAPNASGWRVLVIAI